jgi:cytochrome b subunit of formate dehydrogenase
MEDLLHRLTKKRNLFYVIVSLLSFGLSLYWYYYSRGDVLTCILYTLFLSILLISEIVIWRWRAVRDKKIREIKTELLIQKSKAGITANTKI